MPSVLPSEAMIASHAVTLEEWDQLDEDDSRELVDGRLEEAEVPNVPHERIVTWLLLHLAPYYEARGGVAFGSGIKLACSPQRGRMADVVCFSAGALLPLDGVVTTPPDLVVEVVSRTPRDQKRDRILKPEDYAKLGARLYWLMDPWLRSFEVLELGADRRYVRALATTGGRVDEVPGLPGLSLEIDDLWNKLDALSPGAG
jgi:Uma2 family endonuclease